MDKVDFYSGHQIKALTGLRGVGVLLVVIYHFHLAQLGVFEPFFSNGGSVGIFLFFSLSGYILALLYHAKFRSSAFVRDYASFIWKRFARVYPLHAFLLILLLFVYPKLNIGSPNDTSQLFANLTLTHAWGFDKLSYIAASWSISIEFLFYLFFPFMVLSLNRWVAVAIFLALGIFYALLTTGMITLNLELKSYADHRIFVYGAFFVLGVSVFYMTEHRLVRQLLDNNFAFVALCAIVVLVPYNKYLYFSYPFVIPLLIRSSHTSRIGNYLLSGTVILWLGELSYSIYMSHQLIYLLVDSTGQGKPIDLFLKFGSIYILLFIWCIFCFYVIEMPMRSKIQSVYNRSIKDKIAPGNLNKHVNGESATF